jgi:hypothetical protein
MSQRTITLDDLTVAAVQRLANKKSIDVDTMISRLIERSLFGISKGLEVMASEYKPEHICIMLSSSDSKIKKTFRCTTCGNPVFQYYGSIKLIMSGQFDADGNLYDGEDTDWFDKLGAPTVMECPGRVSLQREDNTWGKSRCHATYYKIGV